MKNSFFILTSNLYRGVLKFMEFFIWIRKRKHRIFLTKSLFWFNQYQRRQQHRSICWFQTNLALKYIDLHCLNQFCSRERCPLWKEEQNENETSQRENTAPGCFVGIYQFECFVTDCAEIWLIIQIRIKSKNFFSFAVFPQRIIIHSFIHWLIEIHVCGWIIMRVWGNNSFCQNMQLTAWVYALRIEHWAYFSKYFVTETRINTDLMRLFKRPYYNYTVYFNEITLNKVVSYHWD